MSIGVGKYEMDELRLVVGTMVILSVATALLVVMPYLLLKDTKPPAKLAPYTDTQLIGRQSYIANGCVYCHSQQPRDIAQAPDALRGWGRASVLRRLRWVMRCAPLLSNKIPRRLDISGSPSGRNGTLPIEWSVRGRVDQYARRALDQRPALLQKANFLSVVKDCRPTIADPLHKCDHVR